MNLSSAERERLRQDPPPHIAFVTTETLLYAAAPHCIPEATPEEIVEALGRAAFSMILDSPHDGATMDIKWMDGSVALTLGVFVVREVRFGWSFPRRVMPVFRRDSPQRRVLCASQNSVRVRLPRS